jgi:hypothetical protein
MEGTLSRVLSFLGLGLARREQVTRGTTPASGSLSQPAPNAFGAEGMWLVMNEVEMDGKRGRSIRLASDKTGKLGLSGGMHSSPVQPE